MKTLTALALLLVVAAGHAETPQAITRQYADAAPAGFVPAARRGEALFRQNFAINDKMPSCTACHTDNPKNPGRHAVTGKTIRPLAVVANGERFSDPAKIEKWFGRNCREVVGRACTPGEKADFVAYLSEVR